MFLAPQKPKTAVFTVCFASAKKTRYLQCFHGPGLAKTLVFTQFSFTCCKKNLFHAKGTKHCKLRRFFTLGKHQKNSKNPHLVILAFSFPPWTPKNVKTPPEWWILGGSAAGARPRGAKARLAARYTTTWRGIAGYTSSTAQGGGGSFKNRKPIGEVGCCESGMAQRSHWWTERCLRSPLFRSLSLTIYLPTYLSSMYLSIDLSISLSLSFICLSV